MTNKKPPSAETNTSPALCVKKECVFSITVYSVEMQGYQYWSKSIISEPRCEKTGLLGFRPGPTLTWLYSYRKWLEA